MPNDYLVFLFRKKLNSIKPCFICLKKKHQIKLFFYEKIIEISLKSKPNKIKQNEKLLNVITLIAN